MSEQGSHRMSDKVAALVTEILAKHGVGSEVAHDVELAKLGMTSIDMVELMLSVEADFDVTIPPADITLENFRSISSIQRLIENYARWTAMRQRRESRSPAKTLARCDRRSMATRGRG